MRLRKQILSIGDVATTNWSLQDTVVYNQSTKAQPFYPKYNFQFPKIIATVSFAQRTLFIFFSLRSFHFILSTHPPTSLSLSFSHTPVLFSLTFSHFLSQIFPRICCRHELHSCSSHSIAHSVPIPYLFRSMRFI